jgi:hypothetical protein
MAIGSGTAIHGVSRACARECLSSGVCRVVCPKIKNVSPVLQPSDRQHHQPPSSHPNPPTTHVVPCLLWQWVAGKHTIQAWENVQHTYIYRLRLAEHLGKGICMTRAGLGKTRPAHPGRRLLPILIPRPHWGVGGHPTTTAPRHARHHTRGPRGGCPGLWTAWARGHGPRQRRQWGGRRPARRCQCIIAWRRSSFGHEFNPATQHWCGQRGTGAGGRRPVR